MENNINMFQIILSSGPIIKLVLLLLLIASIFSWSIIFKKIKQFKHITSNNTIFLNLFNTKQSFSEIDYDSKNIELSSFKTIFKNGNEELIKIKDLLNKNNYTKDEATNYFSTFGTKALERALLAGVNNSNKYLEGQLSILASIGSIAPFIGLFGTVWGIINSFRGLASGNASLNAVAPGIAEALVATAIGLAAAIPALWFYNQFNSKQAAVNLDMENFCKDFLNDVERTLISDK